MSDWEPGFTYRIGGDTSVDIAGPDGVNSSIRYVGIGHAWHTIHNGRGRLSTPVEYALAQALIEANERAKPTTRSEGTNP
jgi:hypothetical protein